ncbi:hypothetical protein K505DRAFT_362840 [Melanomma pulvis-pyrius CBS 109.77]|uniref:Apple domain-containing protein n=1 Tax=Melanomma pulvis-pyrius CBS 109.77 TaxID=1314802 RepID=A0A6A6X897_9PLEO|nr:hypothetical protein K505DRAFT_362840 [Melanomma pulvis-pyrius CBS 109.77]
MFPTIPRLLIAIIVITTCALSIAIPTPAKYDSISRAFAIDPSCPGRPGCVNKFYILGGSRLSPASCAETCLANDNCVSYQTGIDGSTLPFCNFLGDKASVVRLNDPSDWCKAFTVTNKNCSDPYA